MHIVEIITDVFSLLLLIPAFLGFIVYPIYEIIQINRIKKNGMKAVATIVDIVRKPAISHDETSYETIIEFKTIGNQLIKAPADHSSTDKIGQKIRVVYSINDPHTFYTARPPSPYFWWIIFILMGVCAVWMLLYSVIKR